MADGRYVNLEFISAIIIKIVLNKMTVGAKQENKLYILFSF